MFSGPLTKEKAEQLAKGQFYAGFFFLPWLWMSNYFFFWDIQKQNELIAWYCRASLYCFIVSCVIAIVYWAIMINMFPDSSLWVIKPNSDEFQEGIFTKALNKDYLN
eukprot:TRINITY_DN3196_c2_g1_i1.p1 TRINITY_DN3196_c2_g1~~TRINITY_DN3196_c2_g1_i1.p1  ORF type:complete len:107 (+),score=13.12 TRINITY_DN3196_c2_g1_i1:70-390(+)